MADFYTQMQGVASGLLATFKQGAPVYISVTPGVGPASNPGVPSEALITVNGAVRGVSTKYVMQKLATAADLQLTVAGSALPGITPKAGDAVQNGADRLKVMEVIKKPAAGTVVAYTFILRR